MMSWSGETHGHGSPAGLAAVGMSEDPNDILVFGYGCKLFRDDEKAAWIDKEEHLIPWMGDASLKVDRYDGRGALMDLKPFVPSPHGYNMEEELTPDERELEKLLDKERYMDLREDSEFDDMDYQESEFRKFQSDVNGVVGQSHYAAIGYSYDEKSSNVEVPILPEPKKVDDDAPYTKPVGLIVPEEICLPLTHKMHAIIQRTAMFIAANGNQMEIILKTKQSQNSAFDFLEYKSPLNPYYKFLVQAIRGGDYTPQVEETSEEIDSSPSHGGSESEDESGYLHPSLFRNSNTDSAPTTTSITYKPPSGPTAYSLLVSKIRGSAAETSVPQTQEVDHNHHHQYYSNAHHMNYPYASNNAHVLQQQMTAGVVENDKFSDPNVPHVRPSSQVPAQQDQQVIEKMASYVVKNGPAFEDLARTKGDPRFVFLQPTHEYHWYYLNCKERFKAESSAVVASGNFVSYSEKTNAPFESTTSSSSNNNSSGTSKVEARTTSTTSSSTGSIKNSDVKKISMKTVQSITLPLSASGIPIANHASISSRPATIPPEVASRIEEIKKKNLNLFAKKEQLCTSIEAASVQKKEKAKIQFSSSIGKSMAIGLDPSSTVDDDVQNICDTPPNETSSNEADNQMGEPMIVVGNSRGNSPTTEASKKSKSKQDGRSAYEDKMKEEVPMMEIETIDLDRDEEEKEKRRKEERRRKAALFLQRLNSNRQKSPVIKEKLSPPPPETVFANNNDIKTNGDTEVVNTSDVESIPDPGNTESSHDDLKENGIRPSAQDRLRDDDSITLLLEIDKHGRRKKPSSRSSSRRVSRSRSRSHRRSSSSVRSFSASSDSLSDSNHVRRKRSKRKHSKKRRKKRDKEKDRSRSSSHSKKSKKHRR